MSEKKLTRTEAIKQFCYECCGWNKAEVRKCPAKKCPLWIYRKGREVKDNSNNEDITDPNED